MTILMYLNAQKMVKEAKVLNGKLATELRYELVDLNRIITSEDHIVNIK